MNTGKAQILETGETNFESEVLRSKSPVIVAFFAPWSHPCHILNAVLEEVATAGAGRVIVVKVNADDNPYLSMWYDIQSIPTLLFFMEGNVRARIIGTASKEAILIELRVVIHAGGASSSVPEENKDDKYRDS